MPLSTLKAHHRRNGLLAALKKPAALLVYREVNPVYRLSINSGKAPYPDEIADFVMYFRQLVLMHDKLPTRQDKLWKSVTEPDAGVAENRHGVTRSRQSNGDRYRYVVTQTKEAAGFPTAPD